MSTQYKAKHTWVKGIQVCTLEGPCISFPRGLYRQIEKIC